MENEILNYKDLAALPKVKAIYDVQQPDLVSYEHRFSSNDRLEHYSYGEVLTRWHYSHHPCACDPPPSPHVSVPAPTTVLLACGSAAVPP